jgi:hypothetical protein
MQLEGFRCRTRTQYFQFSARLHLPPPMLLGVILQRCHLFDICSRTVTAFAEQVWLQATGRSLQDGVCTEDFQAFYELP